MSSTWKAVELKNKWDSLNESLHMVAENLAIRTIDFPGVNQFSTDEEFRLLVNALRQMRNEIQDLGHEVKSQTDSLLIDVKHFYEVAIDYESEIEIFKKGRNQAFELYDNLSNEHKVLLGEFEMMKAEYKSATAELARLSDSKTSLEETSAYNAASNEALLDEVSTLKIELAGLRKRIELLTEENERVSSIKSADGSDRNQLIEQLAKEVKSRNDALVLADAARSELSRLLGECEQDRMAREAAEAERDEALGSVNGLNEMIDELKVGIEEGEKMYKHEIVMRHKIEEQLLAREDALKEATDEIDRIAEELETTRVNTEALEAAKAAWVDEKEGLVSQLTILAQQMAKDRFDNEKLMGTLKSVQEEFANAKVVTDDSVEKVKQMERIVNQLIQDKGELENQVALVEKEKAQIAEDSKDVVELRTRLEAQVKALGEELAGTKDLFNKEKQLKDEASAAAKTAESVLAKNMEEMSKFKESISVLTTERDGLKNNLEGVQKVLQGERQSRADLERSHESISVEVTDLRRTLQEETVMKTQALSSLEAESRSKSEAIKQLDEARKSVDKLQAASDKLKAEVDVLREKAKDDAQAKKDLTKEVDSAKKESGKLATEIEKLTRTKEDLTRKLEGEIAANKENEKGWNTEKIEHAKTYKAYSEEKEKREHLEGENGGLKASCTDAQKARESEQTEHAKTYKAYEAERDARARCEQEMAQLSAAMAQLKAGEQTLLAEISAGEKRIAKLEAKLEEAAEQKDSSARDVGQIGAVRKQLEIAEKNRSDIENRLNSERQARSQLDDKMRDLRSESEGMKIRVNNAEMENAKLITRMAKLESDLEEERRIKNELVESMRRDQVRPAGKSASRDLLDEKK